MPEVDQPIWLKIMQNGSVGEARTKAFLIDRFWVLERSVDIDGADFLIQPRLLSDRFTDRAPPKVGVVQAKYFQDRKTTHHIPCHYVLDDGGQPLKGFFVILHVGREDSAEMYLLTSDEIASSLDRTEDGRAFVVGVKALDMKFHITSRRQALDKMAHEIAIRSTLESFLFLDQVNIPYRKVSESDIDYRYTLPIPNTQADIPKIYHDYRDKLRWLQFDMEEALVAIDTILQTSNPRTALALLEKLDDHRGGLSNRDYLMFGGSRCDLNWSYLPDALDEHDRRYKALEDAGLFAQYIDLSEAVKKGVAEKTLQFEGVAKEGQTLWAALDYDPITLAVRSVDVGLFEKAAPPAATLVGTSRLHDFGGRHKLSMRSEANRLWNGLMNAVLLTKCPSASDGSG